MRWFDEAVGGAVNVEGVAGTSVRANGGEGERGGFGAALDVFDDEPAVPDALKRLSNTVLTSHVAGLSPEAAHDTVQRVADNLVEYFAGRPVLTPVALPAPAK